MGKKKDLFNFNDVIGWTGGGMAYAVAALSEGYCPTHKVKLAPVPPKIERNLDVYPSRAIAHGFCALCPATFTIGHAPWNEHSDTWLAIDDVNKGGGINRRLVINPPPEVDDDEDFYAMDDEIHA